VLLLTREIISHLFFPINYLNQINFEQKTIKKSQLQLESFNTCQSNLKEFKNLFHNTSSPLLTKKLPESSTTSSDDWKSLTKLKPQLINSATITSSITSPTVKSQTTNGTELSPTLSEKYSPSKNLPDLNITDFIENNYTNGLPNYKLNDRDNRNLDSLQNVQNDKQNIPKQQKNKHSNKDKNRDRNKNKNKENKKDRKNSHTISSKLTNKKVVQNNTFSPPLNFNRLVTNLDQITDYQKSSKRQNETTSESMINSDIILNKIVDKFPFIGEFIGDLQHAHHQENLKFDTKNKTNENACNSVFYDDNHDTRTRETNYKTDKNYETSNQKRYESHENERMHPNSRLLPNIMYESPRSNTRDLITDYTSLDANKNKCMNTDKNSHNNYGYNNAYCEDREMPSSQEKYRKQKRSFKRRSNYNGYSQNY
jgi:hypothetical protein